MVLVMARRIWGWQWHGRCDGCGDDPSATTMPLAPQSTIYIYKPLISHPLTLPLRSHSHSPSFFSPYNRDKSMLVLQQSGPLSSLFSLFLPLPQFILFYPPLGGSVRGHAYPSVGLSVPIFRLTPGHSKLENNSKLANP